MWDDQESSSHDWASMSVYPSSPYSRIIIMESWSLISTRRRLSWWRLCSSLLLSGSTLVSLKSWWCLISIMKIVKFFKIKFVKCHLDSKCNNSLFSLYFLWGNTFFAMIKYFGHFYSSILYFTDLHSPLVKSHEMPYLYTCALH